MNSVQTQINEVYPLRRVANAFLEEYQRIKGVALVLQYLFGESEYTCIEAALDGSDDELAHNVAVALLKQDEFEGNVVPFSREKVAGRLGYRQDIYIPDVEQRLSERGENWGGEHILALAAARRTGEVSINNQTVPRFSEDVNAALQASGLLRALKRAFDVSSLNETNDAGGAPFKACQYDLGYRVADPHYMIYDYSIMFRDTRLSDQESVLAIMQPIIPDDSLTIVLEAKGRGYECFLHFVGLVPDESEGAVDRTYKFILHTVSGLYEPGKVREAFYSVTKHNHLQGYRWSIPSGLLRSSRLTELCQQHNDGHELFDLNDLSNYAREGRVPESGSGLYCGCAEVTVRVRGQAPRQEPGEPPQVGSDLKLATALQLLARCFEGDQDKPIGSAARGGLERLSTLSSLPNFWSRARPLSSNDSLQCEYTGSDYPASQF